MQQRFGVAGRFSFGIAGGTGKRQRINAVVNSVVPRDVGYSDDIQIDDTTCRRVLAKVPSLGQIVAMSLEMCLKLADGTGLSGAWHLSRLGKRLGL
jgi:hypothetical protein